MHGAVVYYVPIGWHAIGYLMFAAVIAALLFASLAKYERVEVVRGEIRPDRGLAQITAPRAGILDSLRAAEGQHFSAGEVLATVRADDLLAAGESASSKIEEAVARQAALAAQQAEAARAVTDEERRRALAERQGILNEIGSLRTQIGLQNQLTNSAREDVELIAPIAQRGFISGREVAARRDTLLQRRQQLAQLEQTLAGRISALAEIDRTIAKAAAEGRSQIAQLAGSREQIAQSATTARAARIQALVTPLGGRVSALTVRQGEPVTANQAMMTIVPDNSVMQAQLVVPPDVIGFVRPGQVVRLAIDSFPYDRFGTVVGTVSSVAAAPVSITKEDGGTTRAYPVTVTLGRQAIEAFGLRRPLISGMTLTARIVTDKRSLYEWMLEPIFAVRRR